MLVATDVAARGLDIAEVEHVIHYDVPLNAEVEIRHSILLLLITGRLIMYSYMYSKRLSILLLYRIMCTEAGEQRALLTRASRSLWSPPTTCPHTDES